MTEFTPISGLAGGLMIGLAAVLLLGLNGRIAGISGIIGGLLPPLEGSAAGGLQRESETAAAERDSAATALEAARASLAEAEAAAQPPRDARGKPLEWRAVFDECAALGELSFRFRDDAPPCETASTLAQCLGWYPAEAVLSGSYLFDEFAPEQVRLGFGLGLGLGLELGLGL